MELGKSWGVSWGISIPQWTFDAYLYQIIENKQKFISQIMTSKSPARSVEDIYDDDGGGCRMWKRAAARS